MKKFHFFLLIIAFASTINYGQDKVKFSGLMFGDYFYNSDNVTPANINMNGFQFRRIYFTADIAVADNFDARFRTETDQSASSNTNGGKLGVMVKDAYLRWKGIFSGADLVIGISPTPAYDVSEGAWGYRCLEKTIMDLDGIVPSRDFGIDLKGKFNDAGSVNYWLKIANNSGNAPETDKYKRYSAMIQLKAGGGFQATIYGDYAAYGQKTDSFTKTDKENNALVTALFLNYQQKNDFAVGLEGFLKSQQNNYAPNAATALQDQSGRGISFWAWISLTENIKVVGRFDNFDPNTDRDNDGISMILGGVDFKIAKNISLIPNIQIFNYQNNTDHKNMTERITLYFTF